MENLPIIKVYDVDYSFIIKNYLNPEMWSKKWTLFQYKGFVFTLQLVRIDCDENKIVFYVCLEDRLEPHKYWAEWEAYPNRSINGVSYSLKIDDIKFLKNKIYSAMKECIRILEDKACKALCEYQEMRDDKWTEREVLTEVAEQFLNDNNVYNSEIRDVYIENYIENNSRVEEQMQSFINNNRYRLLTDLYLILAESQNDEMLLKIVLNTDNEYTNIYEEVKQYMEYLETEECREKLEDNLEDL